MKKMSWKKRHKIATEALALCVANELEALKEARDAEAERDAANLLLQDRLELERENLFLRSMNEQLYRILERDGFQVPPVAKARPKKFKKGAP